MFVFFFLFSPWMVIQSMGNRIIEIEWAVKNNKEYVPSPKPPRKNKNKKKSKNRSVDENDAMDVDDNCGAGGSGKNHHSFPTSEFGNEVTNTDSPNKSKRSLADIDEVVKQTPAKRLKRSALETPIR
jgi:kinesin family protein 22